VFGIVANYVIALMRSVFGLVAVGGGKVSFTTGPIQFGARVEFLATSGDVGNTNGGLSQGYFSATYGWTQTWNAVPYLINPSGNDVQVGTGFVFAAAARLTKFASDVAVTWQPTTALTGAGDIGLARAAAGVLKVTDAAAGTGWLQNTAGRARNTADVTNATTTFANLTDETITLKAGRKYTGLLYFRCSDSTAADGIKFDFNGGTATMTNFNAGVVANVQGATAGVTVSAALATALTFTAMNGVTDHWIGVVVSMVVNAGGTFIPRFAQNAHSTGTATAALGSWELLEDSPN